MTIKLPTTPVAEAFFKTGRGRVSHRMFPAIENGLMEAFCREVEPVPFEKIAHYTNFKICVTCDEYYEPYLRRMVKKGLIEIPEEATPETAPEVKIEKFIPSLYIIGGKSKKTIHIATPEGVGVSDTGLCGAVVKDAGLVNEDEVKAQGLKLCRHCKKAVNEDTDNNHN